MNFSAKQWTPEENDFLIKNYQNLSNQEIAAKIGRTAQAVTDRKKRMNLRSTKPEPSKQKQCTCCKVTKPIELFWSSKIMTAKTKIMSHCRECRNSSRQKQRAEIAAVRRACERGGFNAYWTDADFDYIRQNHTIMNDSEMGMFLGRSSEQVKIKRQGLGLPACAIQSNISETEEYKEHVERVKRMNQKELDENIELIRQETIYLISAMSKVNDETVLECERKLDEMVIKNPASWWQRRVNWKLGQFIELILPGYKFVSVL